MKIFLIHYPRAGTNELDTAALLAEDETDALTVLLEAHVAELSGKRQVPGRWGRLGDNMLKGILIVELTPERGVIMAHTEGS